MKLKEILLITLLLTLFLSISHAQENRFSVHLNTSQLVFNGSWKTSLKLYRTPGLGLTFRPDGVNGLYINGSYKAGRYSRTGIDSDRSGDLNGWRINGGYERNISLNQRWKVILQAGVSYESYEILNGSYRFLETIPWENETQVLGFEVNGGVDFVIYRGFGIRLLTTLNYQTFKEQDSLFGNIDELFFRSWFQFIPISQLAITKRF